MKLKLKKRDSSSKKIFKKRFARRLLSKSKRKFKRAGLAISGRRATSRISVPYALSIESDKNRIQFTRFMQEFRRECLQNRCRIVLDFNSTEVILPAAMILLVAELDRAKRIFKEQFSVTFSNVRNITVKQLLVQIGLYELCGLKPPKLNSSDFVDNVRHWRFATAERADEDTNDAFAAIEGRICSNLRRGMWRGVSEAIINSVQHAYAAPRGVPGPRMNHKRWWMFSQEKDGELTVVVCDLGIGIPRSLPLNWEQSVLRSLMSAFTDTGPDVAAVRAALKVGNTSTGKKHRGKGLPQIWNAVKSDKNSAILLHSNRARLHWSGQRGTEEAKEFPGSIFGTVIMWKVPVEGDPVPSDSDMAS